LNRDLLTILVCPSCRSALELGSDQTVEGFIESGLLRCSVCPRDYPIIRGVPRFVSQDNYAESFGFQWNRFPRTQLDSVSGQPITRTRFFHSVGWSPTEMTGRLVLDVGCGSGRFAEVAASTGARVVAVDYSAAVDAAQSNLGRRTGVDVVQADIYALPFRDRSFDFVYCLGVLQHTPAVKKAFLALPPKLKRGGRLAVDLYPKLLANILWPKYWLRPITRRMKKQTLFRLVERWTPRLLPLSRAIARIPVLGRRLRYFVPVADYKGILPLDDEALREWSILDTFDMFSPAHDHPQSAAALRSWLAEAGLEAADVFRMGHLIGRGVRP
jgi:SAM-dependent methyltransferase